MLKSWGINVHLAMLDWFKPEEFTPTTDMVGFSAVCEGDYILSLPYIRRAKALGKTTILGGTWAGLNRPVDRSVDLVCRGDGESLPQFILGGDQGLFESSMVVPDLNSLPLQDYEVFSGVEFDRALGPMAGKKLLPYVSSRGCNAGCRFCQARLQPPRRVRTRVEEDLTEVLSTYRPDAIYFADATMPYDDEGWRESWGELRVPFCGYIRADIEPDTLLWLIDRGLTLCAFGVESGDEEYRNTVLGKRLTDDQIITTTSILNRNGVPYITFYMTGTPGESWLGLTRTLKATKRFGGILMVWQYQDLTS
jgi:radical SAM superfamily enzyme YgiQ (UPF0313 family)